MITRNNWKNWKKSLKQLRISIKLSSLDLLTIEIDVPRNFYMLTVANFSIKNR
jgi:hypothetical protein